MGGRKDSIACIPPQWGEERLYRVHSPPLGGIMGGRRLGVKRGEYFKTLTNFQFPISNFPPYCSPFVPHCLTRNHGYNHRMKFWWWLILWGVITCAVVTRMVSPTATPEITPTPTPTVTATLTATALPTATPTATPAPTPTATPTPLPGPALDVAGVHVFPQPPAAGDYLSVDVDPRLPAGSNIPANAPLTLTLQLPAGSELSAPFELMGLDGQYQARLYWAWQAPDLAGMLPLTFTLTAPPSLPDPDPADNVVSLALPLLSPESLAPPEPDTHWAVTEAAGIRLHYLTGSAAERDLAELVSVAETAHANVTRYLHADGDTPEVYLVDRVLGQGGYASPDWVAVTYTDRMYAPVSFDLVMQHELIHRLDSAIGCQTAPSALREGLAVYLPGGHYRVESVRRKTATIVAAGQFVALDDLVGNFYQLQHEVSYAESGALVMYLVEVYGWQGLETACRTMAQAEGDERARLAAGAEALGVSGLDELETDWLAWASEEEVTPADLTLLDVELQLMETMRAYQERHDLSAHFLEGILFDPQSAEEQGIVADFVRRPRQAEAIALELLLALAQEAVRQKDAEQATLALDAVAQVLAEGSFARGLAAEALEITRVALAQGYEPYQLIPNNQGYKLQALNRAAWPEQHSFKATFEEGAWKIKLPDGKGD